jgi:hypothetical protein
MFAGKAAITLRMNFEQHRWVSVCPGLCSATLERWQGTCEAKGRPHLTVLGPLLQRSSFHFETAFGVV